MHARPIVAIPLSEHVLPTTGFAHAAEIHANFFVVRPDFFETMKTRVIAGRTFTEDDNKADQEPRVVIDALDVEGNALW